MQDFKCDLQNKMFYLLAAVSAVIHLSHQQKSGTSDGHCSDGWHKWKKSCYHFSTKEQSWYAALTHCKTLDTASTLTDVATKDENDFLEHQIIENAYIGCYNDAVDRLLEYDFLEDTKELTNAMCIDYCARKGFKYAGTQYSIQCFCGMALDKYNKTDISQCETMCAGNKEERCGGHWKLSVYNTDRSKYWLGGICIAQYIDRQWFANRKAIRAYTNWENKESYCPSTACLYFGPATHVHNYKWNEGSCLNKARPICKTPVRYRPLLQKKFERACANTCEGVPAGHYQSCSRCDGYVSCHYNIIYFRLCPIDLVWDDMVKGCRKTSSTCQNGNFLDYKRLYL